MRRVDLALVHRLFYPAVPALLCASAGERVSAMPVASYLSISSSPPLVGVACSVGGFTMRLASSSRAFSLCILDKAFVGKMSLLASSSGRLVGDKLAAVGLKHRPGRKVKAPVVSGSVAALECALQSRRRLGDHYLLIGRVEAAYASQDFREYWRYREYEPILYTGWIHGMRTFGRT
jgi:flavin reductase (DIM6/NTAB) family NADH-FMN oxidoreductase RutF